MTVAERIRSQMAALCVEVPVSDGPNVECRVTVSIGGVALTNATGDAGPVSLEAAIAAADSAVYAAKRAGRNRVSTCDLDAA